MLSMLIAALVGALPATDHITVLHDVAGGNAAIPIKSVPLPDGGTLDLNWVAEILEYQQALVRFGDTHPGGGAKALFTKEGDKARWLDPRGKLWAHVEYTERPLGGNSLFAPPKGDGRVCYACQWRGGKRHGWQLYVHSFVLATKFEDDKPLVTHDVRDGQVVETWNHKGKESLRPSCRSASARRKQQGTRSSAKNC